ncbi:pancreatic lipase-related protein 2-like [Ptychodera flava]|uniref:pancreatic lipase-related protein 2-like n=1 Tax=Ptychodera flava TaxID=63121 RepID=UPI003969EDCD
MKTLPVISSAAVVLFLLQVSVEGKSVCYDELGCFTTDPPFYDLPYRPLTYLPEDPSEIDTTFTLYTNSNPTTGHVISAYDKTTVESSPFDPSGPTIVIAHGYLEYGDTTWMHHTKLEFLKKKDCNVVLTNWRKGAVAGYTVSTANTQVVGAEIALLLTKMQEWASLKLADVHLIGFSLGAHIAGYAGERLNKVGRITGLDPAEPYFKDTHPIVRLDTRDATFVDIIHTDAESLASFGFGMREPIGHVDFFPNGGHIQPGCDQDVVDRVDFDDGLYEGGKYFVACNHFRATEFFNISINFDPVWLKGVPCADEDTFNAGDCLECGWRYGCNYMGYHSTLNKPSSGVELVTYFLDTRPDYPYYANQYRVQLVLGDDRRAEDQPAWLYLTLEGDKDISVELQLNEELDKVKHSSTYTFMIVTKDVGDLTKAYFRWVHDPSLLKPGEWDLLKDPKLYIDQIIVDGVDDVNQYYFCGKNNEVIAEETAVFDAASSC